MGYTPNVVAGVWVGNDDNTVMNKSIQGGTVPALIWKDVMKVATEPYGKADFNYPIVELMPFGSVKGTKVVGENAEPKDADNNEEETINLNETPVLPDSVKKIEQQTKPVSHSAQVSQPSQSSQVPTPVTPKPVAAPAQKPASAPIPLAVPQDLR